LKFKDRKSCKKVLMRVKGRALERNKPRDISDTRENHDLRNNPFRDTINYNFGFGDSMRKIKTHDSYQQTSILGFGDVPRD
jgi:hypothetical protein